MQDEYEDQPERRSLANLIAWLSLCLLSAAWGAAMPSTLRTVWGYVGLFGLAAGVGLSAAERARRSRREQGQRRALRAHAEAALVKFTSEVVRASGGNSSVASDAGGDRSIAHVRKNGASAGQHAHETQTRERSGTADGRSHLRLPFHRSVKVTPLGNNKNGSSLEDSKSVTAYTRDISPQGIGLLHDRPIETGPVLLTFELIDGNSVSLAAELKWCRNLGDSWYSSGTALLDALPPELSGSRSEKAAGQLSV